LNCAVESIGAGKILHSGQRSRCAVDLRGGDVYGCVDIRIDYLSIADVRRCHAAIGD